MIEMINLLLSEHTYRTVALGCMLLGTISGVVGCYGVLRRQSLLGDTVSHASLSGICIMYLITKTKNTNLLLIGALITGLICIFIISVVQKHTKVKSDSLLAFLLSVFFGLGIVLLSYMNKIPGANKSGLNKFIFGQASTLTTRDIRLITFVGIVLFLLIILLWKELKIVVFDPSFANTLGFKSRFIETLISVMIIAVVIVGIQAVGIILITAMIICPFVAARQWTDKLLFSAILSGIIGGIAGLIGTMISMNDVNIPTGPIIVLIISIFVFVSVLFAPKRGLVSRLLQREYNKKRLLKKMLLEKSKRGEV